MAHFRTATWYLLAGAIAWQAAVGVTELVADAWSSRGTGLLSRFGGEAHHRLARDLGADLAVVESLRAVARPGELALCRFEPRPEAFEPRTGIAARLARLRHALFPSPMVTQAGPAPLPLAESVIQPGQSALLLVFDGEPSPIGRDRWTQVGGGEGFTLWRLEAL